MDGNQTFQTLTNILESALSQLPDPRTGQNTGYSMRDMAFAPFSVFMTQSPSFLAFQRSMELNAGNNNARTLFGIERIPSDSQIRRTIDEVPSSHIAPVFSDVLKLLEEQEVLDGFRWSNNDLLVPLDGTGYFSSNAIHCPHCQTKQHKNGTITYSHSVVLPAIVKPGKAEVIPLVPEFIRVEDGSDKQDCENAAAKRWLEANGAACSQLGVTILGDDLYCNQPVITSILAKDLNYILVCKPDSHKSLFEWIGDADTKKDLHEFTMRRWDGKQRLFDTHQYVNGVPIRATEDALLVNWAQLTITNEQGKVIYRNSFATNHDITRDNVVAVVQAGRARWKIENENNNTLKTKGYHFEHNFGHGEQNLSETLLSLNLVAFLFHTVLEMFDARYRLIRESLPRRKDFYNDIRALTRYICFDSWNKLLIFMLKGLELEDPGG